MSVQRTLSSHWTSGPDSVRPCTVAAHAPPGAGTMTNGPAQGRAVAVSGQAGHTGTRIDQAKFFAANSQFTSAQKFSRYLGRALR